MEYAVQADHVDHIWLALAVDHTEIRAALNTISRRNRDAGFDSRIRTGILQENYQQLPATGIFPCDGLNYADIERGANIFYEYRDQKEMEALLVEKTSRAILAEAWGDIYSHRHTGIHQIHSRRTSCAVTEDIVGRDGALKLYYEEGNTSELLLFKFCGQP